MQTLCILSLIVLSWSIALTAAETQPWSGEMIIEEVLVVPPAPEAKRAELDGIIIHFQERLKQVRKAYAAAKDSERGIFAGDLAHYRKGLEEARRARGGRIVLATRRYLLLEAHIKERKATGHMLVSTTDFALLINRDADSAQLLTIDGKKDEDLAKLAPRMKVDKATDAEPLFNTATKQITITHNDTTVQVRYAPTLPNPYTLAQLETTLRDTGLAAKLATIPGLPMQVTLKDEEGQRHLSLTSLQARSVKNEEMQLPDRLLFDGKGTE